MDSSQPYKFDIFPKGFAEEKTSQKKSVKVLNFKPTPINAMVPHIPTFSSTTTNQHRLLFAFFSYTHVCHSKFLFASSSTLAMKRTREEVGGLLESFDMANCLIMLSQAKYSAKSSLSNDDVFECKTCNRRFSSFQALGGHRASHKKPKTLMAADLDPKTTDTKLGDLSAKKQTKMHECSICGLEFAMGQALGGHMRRHRAVMADVSGGFASSSVVPMISKTPVVIKRSNSLKVAWLDLNLTPLENDLKLLFGKMAPKVDAVHV